MREIKKQLGIGGRERGPSELRDSRIDRGVQGLKGIGREELRGKGGKE